MKIGSLFDGSGGFPLAFSICGFEPVWAAEVEPYPIAVTRSRFPNMKHLGNVSLVNGAEIEPVDVITFGAPCQDMSIAGKRAGMKHEDRGDDETTRSGLFFEAIRITNEMRVATRGKYPRFIIWENVPGAFSSNKGGDFRSVLEAFCSIGGDSVSVPMPEKDKWSYSGEIVGDGYSVAWRTHDAQYWGVPQRRRRIYVVADLNDECAREVLFKPESVRGYFTKGNDAGKEVATNAVGRVDRSVGVECLNHESYGFEPGICKREGNPSRFVKEMSPTLRADMGDNQVAVVYSASAEPGAFGSLMGTKAANIGYEEGRSPTWHQNVPSIVYPSAAFMGGQGSKAGGIGYSEKVSPTLKSVLSGGNTVPDIVVSNYPFRQQSFGDYREGFGTLVAGVGVGKTSETIVVESSEVYPDVVGTLAASGAGTSRTAGQGNETDLVIVEKQLFTRQRSDEFTECNVTSTESARQFKDATDIVVETLRHLRKYIIRRLHPIECARLQGFPDWWGDLAKYDGDIAFWEEVRKTIAAIEGKAYKPSKNLEKWYYGLHTDAAEYKMWGNGIALPFAIYVANNIKTITNS